MPFEEVKSKKKNIYILYIHICWFASVKLMVSDKSFIGFFLVNFNPKALHCGHAQYPAHWAPIPQVFQWLRVRTAHLMSCIYEDAWWNGSIKLVRTDSKIMNSSSWWKLVLRVWNPTILSPSFDPGEPWSFFIDIKQLILSILIWSIFVV